MIGDAFRRGIDCGCKLCVLRFMRGVCTVRLIHILPGSVGATESGDEELTQLKFTQNLSEGDVV